MSVSDPTLESLKRFDDPSRWQVVPRVPIFRAHKRYKKLGADGKPLEKPVFLYEVKDENLAEIADEITRLEKEEGVVPLITIGHRKVGNVAETEQPPIVGYARGASHGKWGPKGTPGVLADLWYRKEDWERAKKFPFRSPEYYATSGSITNIALIERDPELDLGMLIFERYQREDDCQFYDSEPPMADTGPDAKNPKIKGEGEEPAAQTGTDEQQSIDPETEKKFSAYMAKCYPHLAEMHTKYEATMAPAPLAAPSASNAAPPKPAAPAPAAPAPAAAPPPKAEEVQHMDRGELGEMYARVTERLEVLEKQLEVTTYEREKAVCAAHVDKLKREYRITNPDELVEELAGLALDKRGKRISEIQNNYQRLPIGNALRLAPTTGGREPEFTEEKMQEALAYQKQHKCEWEDAMDAVCPGSSGRGARFKKQA